MPRELTLRRAVPDDTERLAALLRDVDPANPKGDPSVLRWQYWDNPWAEAVSWVHTVGDEIVSHLARVPVPVRIGAKETLGVISADAATRAAYRNRGLHAALRDATNDDCCRRGLAVGFHFRASNSMLPSQDAPSVARFRLYVLPIDPRGVMRLLSLPRTAAALLGRRPRPSSGVEVASTPEDLDGLWTNVERHIPNGIVRNGAWWRWRFEGNPTTTYRYFAVRRDGTLNAAAVATVRRIGSSDVVQLLELLASGGRDAADVVTAVGAAFPGAAAIVARACQRTYHERVTRTAGLRVVPRRLERNPVWLCVRDSCGDRPELLSADWSATLGDADPI